MFTAAWLCVLAATPTMHAGAADPPERNANALLAASGASLAVGVLAIGLSSSFAIAERTHDSAALPLGVIGGASLIASIPLAAVGGARKARFFGEHASTLRRRRARAFIAAGSAILPVAVIAAGLGTAAAILVPQIPSSTHDEDEPYDDAALSTGGALALPGAVLLPVAAGLLGYGLALKRGAAGRLSLVPQLSARFAGLALSGRF